MSLRKHTITGTVTAVLLAVLATLFGPLSSAQATDYPCAGGPSSGASSSDGGTCPTLHNENIVPQREFPTTLYRGDSRPPVADNNQGVFATGFTARGQNYDLQTHVHGGQGAMDSGFISTSGSIAMSESFARSQGNVELARNSINAACTNGRLALYALLPGVGPYLMYNCLNGTITGHSYVYLIDPTFARNAMYVPDQLRGNPAMQNTYQVQDEWAYTHHIPSSAIIGVRIYTMTAHYRRGGFLNDLPTFTYDQFVANPNHVAAVAYDPASDANAGWNYNTPLDSPSANAYTRGCSAITQCRSDGNP